MSSTQRRDEASLLAGTAGAHPLLTSAVQSPAIARHGPAEPAGTSPLSLGGLEVRLGTAGSPTAKNNQHLPICDRNLRKHIVKFREGLTAISPNPFVFWHRVVQPLLILGQDFAPSGLPLGLMSLFWVKKKITYEKEQGGAEGRGAAPVVLEDLCTTAKATLPAT